MKIELTDTERADIATSLRCRANYIETGNVTLTALDLEARKKPVKALETSQMKTIVYLRELADRLEP